MEVKVEKEPQAYILRLEGEMDASTCLEVDKAIEDALSKPIAQLWIDCQGLTYISSAGLGVFISHLGTSESLHIPLVLYGLSDHVRNVFELLGLHMIMNIVPTKEEAALHVR